MKAVSAAKAAAKAGVTPAAPPSSQRANQAIDCADPLLQGTYVSQDDIGSSGQDLDAFEARLEGGGMQPRHISSKATGAANRGKAPQAPPPRGAVVAPKPSAKNAAAPPLTEEEEEHLQDVQAVRDLANDESSDDD